MKELLFGNKLTDVTLVSDDKISFKAHKFVIGACSSVLRDLLRETFHPQPTIYLRGIHSFELEAILYFLYRGKTRVYHSRIKPYIETHRAGTLAKWLALCTTVQQRSRVRTRAVPKNSTNPKA